MVTLRPYQLEAIEAVEREWNSVRSTLLVLPTGAGKTVVFVEVARRQHGRILVLAHREELIDQAVQKFEAVGITAEVEKAERRAGKMNTSPVVVASVQTLRGRRLRAWDPSAFSAVIVDEAHHAVAASYRNVLNYFGKAKVLGVTATPDRSDEIGLHNVFETTAYSLSILDLIDQGYLVDVKAKTIVVEDYDISAVKTRGGGSKGDLIADQIEKALTSDKMLHSIAAPLVKEAAGRSVLVFMPGVQSSMDMRRILGGYVDPATVEHIDGATHPMQRTEIIGGFKKRNIQIVTNCMVLTEGFDAPNVEIIALCRPTKSRALFAQMVGRGTRPDPENPAKKEMTLLNFVPEKTGSHQLANPIDILGGKDLEFVDDDVRALAEEALKEGMTPRQAMTRAEREMAERLIQQEIEEKAEKERVRALREARNQHVFVDASYQTDGYDLHGGTSFYESLPGWGMPLATPQQLDLLTRMGFQPHPHMTKSAAASMIGKGIERRKKGQCTPKQEKVLARAGLRTDLSIKEASSVIDALVANRWQATAELKTKYGKR
jgi:superfamily II DNA or RNA helicase